MPASTYNKHLHTSVSLAKLETCPSVGQVTDHAMYIHVPDSASADFDLHPLMCRTYIPLLTLYFQFSPLGPNVHVHTQGLISRKLAKHFEPSKKGSLSILHLFRKNYTKAKHISHIFFSFFFSLLLGRAYAPTISGMY